VLHARLREWVLAAHVQVALLAAGRVGGDRHRLHHGERVALHQHAVLEGPGLGLVGVADQVVRPARLARDRVPLASHRERGAAAPDEAGVHHLADDALRAELERAPQRVVAAVGAVVVQALGIDRADTTQQAQARVARLRRRRGCQLGRGGAGQDGDHALGVDADELALQRRLAGLGEQGGGRAVALPQARAAQPRGAVDLGVLGPEALLEL
jgi:hypothetical protein